MSDTPTGDGEGMRWSSPEMVAGFAQSPPNAALMRFADEVFERTGRHRALDIGCGAGRNAIPLAQMGWDVAGLDRSAPMLHGAARQAREVGLDRGLHLALAAMDRLPVRDRSCDLLVAHGIWNLARSTGEFRRAVAEAARVAGPGAGLFVFTFSRETFGPEVEPVPGEAFVFTGFSGEPQCFLTEAQLLAELGGAGFTPDPRWPLRVHNRRPSEGLLIGSAPVILEAAFRFED